MDITSWLSWVQETGLAVGIRDALFVFPLLESAHVIGFVLVVGSIAVIDLRLLGVASAHRSFQRMASEIMPWTWGAFGVTALTGALMFITNATVYFHNVYFRAKIVLLVLAAVNVAVFELTAGKTVRQWDRSAAVPGVGRAVGAVSLAVWIAVIVAGRMIGFTVRASAADTAPVEINFEDLLGLPAEGTQPAPPPGLD